MGRPAELRRMYDVLLAIDADADRALAQAEAVTDLPGDPSDLHAVLLHVFTGDTGGASVHQLDSIRRAKEHLEDAGAAVTLAEDSGEPEDLVLRVARERDVDLVTVAGRRRSPASKAIMGSVAQAVLLNADRPVLFAAEG